MKRIEWDQGKQTKACNEPSIKQIIFFFNALRIKVNIHGLHNHFWTATCSNPLLLFTDISVDGPTLSCPVRSQRPKHWPYGKNNRPENVNHVTACLQRFVEEAKIQEETEEKETEEEDTVVCGCRHFQPVPRGMRGRRKDRVSEYVGFYDSLLEKP
ncbi:uncharacterized protein TNCV_564841 [Trichonephila clavipes]|nr:uncharacterized protein TNCV_564841 [Trichonephila clavipes]